MKKLNYFRIVFGVITLLGSIMLLLFLISLYLQEEVNDGYFAYVLVIIYLIISVIYCVLNLFSRDGFSAVKKLEDENLELELKIRQMALRHKLETIEE